MAKYNMDHGSMNNDKEKAKPKKHGAVHKSFTMYLYIMRALLARLENGFESFGSFITSHPKRTIFIAMTAVTLSAFGLLRFHVEKRTEKLFVPQNSLAEQALMEGKPYFRNILNTRSEEIIFTTKGNTNILSKDSLEEAAMVINNIKSIPGYKQFCTDLPNFLKLNNKTMFDSQETCRQINFLEILQGRRNYSKDSIFKSFHEAQLSSLLMSNGRTMAVNLPDTLANFFLNRTSKTLSGKALRIVLFLQRTANPKKTIDILNWEKRFTKELEALKTKLKHTSLFFSSERSMEDAISESSTSDIGLVSITFTVMSTFSCLMLVKFVNPVQGHNWLALSGIFSTALGILSGIGVTMLFGLPFISLVGVVPFLVVSIGIDDMFILVDEFDRQSSKHEPRRRVSYALSKIGSTIAMTTVTDVIAFLVSASSAFPAVKYFCIYTAICITLEFLLQITLFLAFLTLDAIRIRNSRSDCCPMLIVPDKTSCNLSNDFSLSKKILTKYATILLKPPVKVLVIVLTLAMCAFGVFGCLNIDTQFNRQFLALPGSHFAKYVDIFESTFPQTIPVSIQTTNRVNYSDSDVRKKIAKSVEIAYNTGFYQSRNFSWIHSFEEFTKRSSIQAEGPHFKTALTKFLNNSYYAQQNLDIIRDKEDNILASRIIVYYKDNTKSEFQKDAMLKLRDELKKQSDIGFTVAADPFIYFEQYAIVIKEVRDNLVLVSLVIAFVLIPFCIHPVIILFILFGFVALVVELFGLMYLWDVQLNSISMINMVMSIGFSVDYSTHIAHAFVTSNQETVDKRIIEALTTIGGSVLLGGTSTFLGMSLTGFASSPIFKIFFKMFVGIILFGLFNGIVLLPVLLSIFSKIVNIRTTYIFHPEDLLSFPWSMLNWSARKARKKVFPVKRRNVSVMGISTRFPTARTKEEFWSLLKEGRNTITEYPENRYARKTYFDEKYHPARSVAGKIYVSKGSYLEGISGFDYTFFGITVAEAKMMDPQQRLLLQGTYEAIEDAGMTLDELQQCSTGVYVGIMNQDYNEVAFGKDSFPYINQFAATGNAYSITANRISFSLNFSGPSMAIDTACSSSITALNIACDHILRGIVDVAIVGAANLILSPNMQAPICRANMLASDGKCKVFDEAADGYGRGEGVSVFILKSSEFVNVTDQPYCEILSWGINNDGKSAAPITAPSIESQKKLMTNILQEACIDPKDIQYVEMHGTGTIIGDKVEVTSVGDVYGQSREPKDPVIVGSVKSNINHTESTAGLAGLAKVCLMMQHKEYVPTVGIEIPATRLRLEQNRLHVQTECCAWPATRNGTPRLASVNSFGFGGSNAHVIVREHAVINPKQVELPSTESQVMMMVMSSNSHKALYAMAKQLSIWIQSLEDTYQNRINICYTLSERRTAHNIRLVVDASSLQNASQSLAEFSCDPEKKHTSICSNKVDKHSSKIAFVFGGQGSQWLGMAGDLLDNKDISQTLNKIDKIAKGIGHEQSLMTYLHGGNRNVLDVEVSLATVQLSIFALQYAVAKFLIKRAGITPLSVCGHSLGDITAACIANIVSLKSAISVIRIRAYLQDRSQTTGAMIAVGLGRSNVEAVFDKLDVKNKVCIAAENDNKSVTISGDEDAVTKFENCLRKEEPTVFYRRLDTQKAFHSHHMEPMRWKFMKKIKSANITAKTAHMRFFSTTEGKELNGNEIDDSYWWRNVRNQVSFSQATEAMISNGARILIEISPRPVLSHYLNEIAKQMDVKEITVLQALPARKESERLKYMHIQCIGKMYTLGYPVNFGLLQNQANARLIRLPTYPWQETDLWANDEYYHSKKTMPLLGKPVSVDAEQIEWENEIGLHNFEFIKDHQLKSIGTILPGACYIEMALNAVLMDTKIEPLVVKDIKFENTLQLNENSVRKIKCKKVRSYSDDSDDFTVKLVAELGEITLSTAILKHRRKAGNEKFLTLSQACMQHRDVSEDNYSKTRVSESGIQVDISSVCNASGKQVLKSCPNKDSDNMENDDLLLQITDLNRSDKFERGEYEDFIANTNFLFGEMFCLIDCSWGNSKKALARINLPKWLHKEMDQYVIHPCIMDACLQTRLLVEAKETGIGVSHSIIPTGLDEVTLYPIEQRFHCLYCFAEVNKDNREECNIKLLDEHGNIIMHIKGLHVKEYATTQRQLSMDKCIYQLNWISQKIPEVTSQFANDQVFIILGGAQCSWISSMQKALTELHVSEHNIYVLELAKTGAVEDFLNNCSRLISDVCRKDRKIAVVNLLPLVSNSILVNTKVSFNAECLCFESTLNFLKVLNENNMNRSTVLAFTSKGSGYDFDHGNDVVNPWAATVWGMARVTNLECPIPLICIDVPEESSTDICINAILSIDMKSVENGIIVTRQNVLQPRIERADLLAEHTSSRGLAGEDSDFYLSWSDSQKSLFVKKVTKSISRLKKDHIEIIISHISSVMGQCEDILENVKSYNSQPMLQSVVGIISQVTEGESEYRVGDHIIGLVQSKWIKRKVQVPLHSILKKPKQCKSEWATVLPGCIMFAHHILNKVKAICPEIKSMLVAASSSSRGLCWVISAVAGLNGVKVTTTEDLNLKRSKEGRMSSTRCVMEILDEANSQKSTFDCIVCSSELYSVENATLAKVLVADGVLAIIDITGNSRISEHNFQKSVTLINAKPFHMSLKPEEKAQLTQQCLADTISLSAMDMPGIEILNIADICSGAHRFNTVDGQKNFYCLCMDLVNNTSLNFQSPSMDFQGLKEDRSYIVVGGTRGLGLSTVIWMASRGAGVIVPLSRSDISSDTREKFKTLEEKFGSKIVSLKLDISSSEGVSALEKELNQLPSIAGIVNSAGVLDDKLFMEVDRKSYQRVMASKVDGTLLLHEMLERRNEAVDFFVLYSSITSVVGNEGQTSYAAANAFLNSFADYRVRSLKKPCLSICWGAMDGVGMLKRAPAVAELLQQKGLNLLNIQTGLKWMEAILTSMPDRANIIICDIDWINYFKSMSTTKASSIIFDSLRKEFPESNENEEEEFFNLILNTKSLERQQELVLNFIVIWLAKWIGGNAEEVDCNVPFFTYGIDSIGASVFKLYILQRLRVEFEVFYFMLPETTATSLTAALVDAVNEKFRKTQETKEKHKEAQTDLINEQELLTMDFRSRQTSHTGPFHSFRRVAPQTETSDPLVLPADYLSPIYNPADAKSKLFIVHPSHRYAGIFQGLAAGMKYQELFSVYAFGSPDPGYLGEDIGSVRRLAKACTEMILKLQPHGPYFLGGYSFGGLVAIEIATILQSMGKQTGQLIMIDTFHWVPEAKSNYRFLMESFGPGSTSENIFLEQVRSFLCQIATTQLNMTQKEFDEKADEMIIDDVAQFLNERASRLSMDIPDMRRILRSTLDDQKMATKYHNEWIPPMNIYKGQVIFIKAESCLCAALTGSRSSSACFCGFAIASAASCWSSVFEKKVITATCPGNHYSMMDQCRAQNVGKVLALAATLRYRDLFPMIGRIALNANHTTTMAIFKERGMKVLFIHHSVFKTSTNCCVLRINKSHSKLKLTTDSSRSGITKIRLRDVVNISMQDPSALANDRALRKATQLHVYSGYCLLKKDHREDIIMCFNRQDFQRLTYLLEAAYRLKLPC